MIVGILNQVGVKVHFILYVIDLLINDFRIHRKYGDAQKPKRGPQFKLSTEDELHLVTYTNFCWERNIPKTEQLLGPEIVHYLDVEGKPNKFKNQTPGIRKTRIICEPLYDHLKFHVLFNLFGGKGEGAVVF